MLPNLSFYERVYSAAEALASGHSVSIRGQDLNEEDTNLEEIRFHLEEILFGNLDDFQELLPLLSIKAIGDTGAYRLKFDVVNMYE